MWRLSEYEPHANAFSNDPFSPNSQYTLSKKIVTIQKKPATIIPDKVEDLFQEEENDAQTS